MSGSATTWRRRSLPPLTRRQQALRVVSSPDTSAVGRELPLDGTTSYTLGREGDGPARVDDPRMSRRHARVVPHASGLGYTLDDLGGDNGVFLDGVRVARSSALGQASVVSLGDTLWVVDGEPEPDDLPVIPAADDTRATEVVGVSRVARRLRQAAESAAGSPGAVLLLGPTGVGKDVLARAIHRLSGRGAWVAVNCASIPPELADSQLFGHARGAFTGADREREGLFVRASGGTLFLDEVGELPPPVQAKLLRVLEERAITPVGADVSRAVDVRVIAATLADVAHGSFRRDLFARLADWVHVIPPLSARRADILPLFHHLCPRPLELTPEAAEALLLEDWPLNVRELQKLAQRLALTVPVGEPVDLPHLPRALVEPLLSRDAAEGGAGGLAEIPPVAVIERALERTRGNVKQAAEDNGWHRTQLYRWIRRAGIDAQRYR